MHNCGNASVETFRRGENRESEVHASEKEVKEEKNKVSHMHFIGVVDACAKSTVTHAVNYEPTLAELSDFLRGQRDAFFFRRT